MPHRESVCFRIFTGCTKNDLIRFNCSAKITRVRVTFIVPDDKCEKQWEKTTTITNIARAFDGPDRYETIRASITVYF